MDLLESQAAIRSGTHEPRVASVNFAGKLSRTENNIDESIASTDFA